MITAEALQGKVLQLINEMDDDSDVTLLTRDSRQLLRHIDALMPQAVLFVQKNKGGGMLNPKSYVPGLDKMTYNGDGTGSIVLPDDFVALIALRFDKWKRDCTILYDSDSYMAQLQSNPYTRSGCCRPVCTRDVSKEGAPALCFWASQSDSLPVLRKFIYEASYLPSEGLSGNDKTLHNAVACQCAGLLMTVFERRDSAASFFALAASCLNNVEQSKEK